jgi:membrane-associated protease RseP (regulator of RpoE activity)
VENRVYVDVPANLYQMDWLLIIAVFVGIYAIIAGYIKIRGLWGEHVMFYGPILALKTSRVGIFDWFTRYARFLRLYGTAGVALVAIISVLISILLVLSVNYTLIFQPEPTGIYEPQNILLLPGINEFIPSTFAVWFAFLLTIFIHEFGHGILCRVEQITVRSMGALIAVIPIGFFVEPDEEELEALGGMPKVRMFGAGISNNMVVGFACFGVLLLLAGMAVPVSIPLIHGIYQDSPADLAGIPANSRIVSVNGIPVETREEISGILDGTRPGDQVTIEVIHEEDRSVHTLILGEWPEEMEGRDSGFMGIYYFDAQTAESILDSLGSPLGFLRFITIPFDTSLGGKYLRVLAFDSIETTYFIEPFALYWELAHLFFWSAWININVGIFNAIPMIPLDGGYIMQEGVRKLLPGKRREPVAKMVVAGISWVMLLMILSIILLPYLLHL